MREQNELRAEWLAARRPKFILVDLAEQLALIEFDRPFGVAGQFLPGDAEDADLDAFGAFGPAREKRKALAGDPAYVEEVLRSGAERLAPQAAATMAECHARMGLAPRP